MKPITVLMAALFLVGCNRNQASNSQSKAPDDRMSPQAAPIVQPKPQDREPTAKSPSKSSWSVKTVTLTPVKDEFEEEVGSTKVRLAPGKDDRFVRVQFDVQAMVADPRAVEKLAEKRKQIQTTIRDKNNTNAESVLMFLRGGVALSPERQKKLNGQYRLFDMANVVIVDTAGNHYLPVWCRTPQSMLTLLYDERDGILENFSEKASEPDHWHETLRSNEQKTLKVNGMFVGLLEVGPTKTVSLLYKVPRAGMLETLTLKLEDGEPVAVKTDP